MFDATSRSCRSQRNASGLERNLFRAQYFGDGKAMEKKLWKLIANVPGIAGKPGVKEYYVVREVDEQNAIVALLCARADLQAATVELRGQADQAFIEWVQPNRDVFQVMVVS
jgi:hypothetical protein